MPLVGRHPARGVQTHDVVQELLSMAEACARTAPGLARVELLSSRAATYDAMLADLRRPEYALLLAPQLPQHLGAVDRALASPSLPGELRLPCELIALAGRVRSAAPVGDERQRTALFASVCCLQARTMLDWLLTARCGQPDDTLPCGHIRGCAAKLADARAQGRLTDAQLAAGCTINRHGNKAAHSTRLDGVTLTDCNSVLTALLQLLRDFQV